MNIFIKKLSYDTTESSLRIAFEQFGTVVNCNIVMDEVAKRSKGFGFVEMSDDEEANNAIERLHNSKLDGRAIAVKEAKPKESVDADNSDGAGKHSYNSYDSNGKKSSFSKNDRGGRKSSFGSNRSSSKKGSFSSNRKSSNRNRK